MRVVRFDEPYQLGNKQVFGRLVIPSGIRCTRASTIQRCLDEIPPVGLVTTKSISAQPRAGYREPIFARYAPGCYINAVGLANPGAQAFREELREVSVPANKFLLVSLMGSTPEEFLEAARPLVELADGFELNMSCPHARGYGMEVGQDPAMVGQITRSVVEFSGKPVFVKLGSTVPNLAYVAQTAIEAGAAGLTLINTVGPAMAMHEEFPVLHNRYGGLSGDGIRPMGLRAVEQVRKAVGEKPCVIGMGGIATAEHIRQYAAAGADLFGVGSALTGMDTAGMRAYLMALYEELTHGTTPSLPRPGQAAPPMEYVASSVRAIHPYGQGLFKIYLEHVPGAGSEGDLAGKFFFLWIPGVGEKPFAVFSAVERSVVVRVVGHFTERLSSVVPGEKVFLRGPYGKELPQVVDHTVVLVGGGTGIASLWQIAVRLKSSNRLIFLLGARTREHLFDRDKFASIGELYVATEDGTLGHRGLVTDLLEPAVGGRACGPRQEYFFINCGPEGMVRKCFELESSWAPPEKIWGAIEYMTSCGVGICGKCASPSGALTCVDGPFMPMREFASLRLGSG